MSIRATIKATCDLARPLTVTPLRHALVSGDDRGDLFELTILQNGEPADITGAGVVGYFIREADGATVTMNGVTSGNKAALILPASCYAETGQFTLTVKIARQDERHTVYVAEGAVLRSSTDTMVDPGHVIPSLEELLAQVARIESTIQAAETATGQAVSAVQQAANAVQRANGVMDATEAAGASAISAAHAANQAAEAIDGLTVEASDGEAVSATVSDVAGHKHIAFTLRAGRDGKDGKDGAKGEPGLPNIVKGQAYASLEALRQGVPSPAEGDQYNVGEAPPYHVYRWTGKEWEDQGVTQGPKGDPGAPGKDGEKGADGKPGVTFTPSVDQEGNLSWTNDQELPNPETVNIRGPQGVPGSIADIPYSDEPAQDLGVAAAGASMDVARADHVHKLPSAMDIGAIHGKAAEDGYNAFAQFDVDEGKDAVSRFDLVLRKSNNSIGIHRYNVDQTDDYVQLVDSRQKINGKTLSGDISLTAKDVGAVSSVWGAKPDDTGDAKPEVGGMNILRGTNEYKIGTGSWKTSSWRQASGGTGTLTVVKIEDFMRNEGNDIYGVEIDCTAGNYDVAQDTIPIMKDKTYTLSFYAKVLDKTPQFLIRVGGWVYGSSDRTNLLEKMVSYTEDMSQWKKYAFSFNIPSDKAYDRIMIQAGICGDGGIGKARFCMFKLEEGVVPTAWSPAPEDKQDKIERIGGRNLFSNAAAKVNEQAGGKTTSYYNDQGSVTVEIAPYTDKAVSVAYESNDFIKNVVIERDQWYSLSFDAKADKKTDIWADLYNELDNEAYGGKFGAAKFSLETTKKRFAVSDRLFFSPEPTKLKIRFWRMPEVENTRVEISNIKFEYGAIPTDWSPAVEELVSVKKELDDLKEQLRKLNINVA